MKVEIFDISQMVFQIPLSSYNRDERKMDIRICTLTGTDLLLGYEGEYVDCEFIFSLGQNVDVAELLALPLGGYLNFPANRDVPEEGTLTINRIR